MKALMIIFLVLSLFPISFQILADTCQAPKAAMNISTALKNYGSDYCPGGCQSHYKIPAGSTQSIWFKGKCRKITNLSKMQPLFIPAEHEAFESPSGTVKKHKRLGCVGDFYNTKSSNREDCNRGVQIKVENCDNPYIVEEIVQICYPGCSYIYTWQTYNTTVDPVTNQSSTTVENHSETRYLGAGSPCTYYKRIKLMWKGINRHNPNNSKELVTTTEHVLDGNYDQISCVRPVPSCQGSAGQWVCVTCIPGVGLGPGCTNKSGEWNTTKNPENTNPDPPSYPQHSGGSSTTY